MRRKEREGLTSDPKVQPEVSHPRVAYSEVVVLRGLLNLNLRLSKAKEPWAQTK